MLGKPRGGLGKLLRVNERLREELAYCVPLGIPHSKFLGWDEDDQDKALAYIRDQANFCPGCGVRHSDWLHDEDAYVGWVTRCEGCKRLEQERENLGDRTAGAHIGLMPRAEAERRMAAGEEGT